jgi:phosphate transport system protein
MEPRAQSESPAPPTLADQMQRIRDVVLQMGDAVDRAIVRSTRGLTARDVDLCASVIRDDAQVNAMLVTARELSMPVLAGASAASDLREVMGFLHMASELERMADHCANIARIGRDLADLPPLGHHVDISRLSEVCGEQLRDILGAVIARDVVRARAIAARDDRVNRIYHRVVDELIQLMTENGDLVYRGTKLIMAGQNLERIGDRVTNLAEDLLFRETGEIVDLG